MSIKNIFKKLPKLTFVKKLKQKLTFELIKKEAKAEFEKIYQEKSKDYTFVPSIFGIETYEHTGRILSLVLIHDDTGELKIYALKHLIPDFNKRFEV